MRLSPSSTCKPTAQKRPSQAPNSQHATFWRLRRVPSMALPFDADVSWLAQGPAAQRQITAEPLQRSKIFSDQSRRAQQAAQTWVRCKRIKHLQILRCQHLGSQGMNSTAQRHAIGHEAKQLCSTLSRVTDKVHLPPRSQL